MNSRHCFGWAASLVLVLIGCTDQPTNELPTSWQSLTFTDADGHQVHAVDSTTQLTLLHVSDTGCGLCVGSLESVQRVLLELEKEGEVMSVRLLVVGPRSEATALIDQLPVPSQATVLFAEDIALRELPQVRGSPMVLLVRRDGSVAHAFGGLINIEAEQDARLRHAVTSALRD